MKKLLLIVPVIGLFTGNSFSQDIATARNATVGSTVTFRGVALNGSELPNIRYIQDATAGIAIYGTNLTAIAEGDSVLVTGTLTNYNNLAEVSPVTSFTQLGTVALPTVQIITDVNTIDDNIESELVGFNNCTFVNGGNTFAGNTNYDVNMGSQTFQVRILNGSPMIGQVIPTGVVDLTGIMSQYCFSPTTGCTTGYQLLLRTMSDIQNASSIYFTSPILPSAITTSGFDISWSTNIGGTNSYIKYGLTPNFELGTLSSNNAANHTVTLSGLQPATIYYVKAYSWNNADSAVSTTKVFATQSLSSGTIKAYFNRFVENSYSSGTNAIQLDHLIADTLAAYIDRAQSTLDICIYNWDTSTDGTKIITAVNNAYGRGVKIRLINDGSTANTALTNINPAIPVLTSPQGADYTIMHNKFVIIDANASNPNFPIVWTGSTNFTNTQLTTDANNVIIFQDQSLARGYKLEFDEMWGDTSQVSNPNLSLGRFGEFKTDNTPHEYLIGGKRVESYFSPSDQTNTQILKTIATANTDLHFGVMTITRSDLAYAIVDQLQSNTLDAKGIVDDSGTSTTPWSILSPVMGTNLAQYVHGWIFHHKYMIVDQSNASSDPLVLTGSHNWSNGADQQNDENTVIVHDGTIANQYYQEFMGRWCERNGQACANGLSTNDQNMEVLIYPNPNNGSFKLQFNGTGSNAQIRIFDISGKQLFEKTEQTTSGTTVLDVTTSSLTKGTYFLELTSNGQTTFEKIVVR